MASVRVEANHGAGSQCSPPPWKLYHNPHYSPHDPIHLSYSSRSPGQTKNLDSPMIVVPEDDEVVELDQDQGYGAMSSELELCVARIIRDLRADLELERRMRRKAEALSEALAAELADERRRGEAECRALREEAAAAREAMEDVEEERRMLRVAELWREERVQMKLADARAAVEEKLREIDDAVAELHAASDNHNKSSCCSCSSPNGKASPTSQRGQQQSLGRSQHGQESPSRSQQGQRREASGGGENPHIRRGIKGFVEFPKAKALRVRPREERVDLVSNLECQRAQLRVLMRHRSPAAPGMGLVAVSENLVV